MLLSLSCPSFLIHDFHQIINKSIMMADTSDTVTAHPSWEPAFAPRFEQGHVVNFI
jgi:hypothetical protein